MKIFKNTIITIAIVISGLIITYSLNYLFVNDLIIGNPNSYDIEHIKTSTVFDFFFTISSDTGYRPEPSNMNFLVTFLTGLIIGLLTSYKLIWMKR